MSRSARFQVSSSRSVPLEADEQAAFFAEAAYTYRLWDDFAPLLLFATFNGEVWRSFNKVMPGGLVRGVSDILYLQARGGHTFFACELKRQDRRGEKNGGLTEAEQMWLAKAKEAGACTCVAYGADEALAFFARYMQLTPRWPSPDLLSK